MSNSKLKQIIEDRITELALHSNIRVSRLRKIVSEEVRMAFDDTTVEIHRLIPEINDSQYQDNT